MAESNSVDKNYKYVLIWNLFSLKFNLFYMCIHSLYYNIKLDKKYEWSSHTLRQEKYNLF